MRALGVLVLAAMLPWLSACGALPKGGPLTHHVAVTLDDGRCMAASRWGSLSITGDINESECSAIVEGRYARELLRLMGIRPRPQTQQVQDATIARP